MTQKYINVINMNEIGRPITVGDLKRLLIQNKLEDETPLLLSGDEEGNSFGECYEASIDFNVPKMIKELGEVGIHPPIPADAKAVLILMPAI